MICQCCRSRKACVSVYDKHFSPSNIRVCEECKAEFYTPIDAAAEYAIERAAERAAIVAASDREARRLDY